MRKKRTVILCFCFIIFLCIPFSSFAQDIYQEGFGLTIDEARRDARENLSRYLNGEFISAKTSTSVSETQNPGMSSGSSSFFAESNSVSMGYLKAVEYINEKKDGDGYRITAVIKDTEVNLSVFESEMSDLTISINSLYNSLVGKDDQIKKGILISLYGVLSEFDNYKRTLIYMGHSELVPNLGLMITATSILSDYQNIVLSEGYRLEELEQHITDEAEKKKLQDALNENRKEQRRLEKEKNNEIASREEASRNLLLQKLSQAQTLVSTNTPKIESSDFKTLLDEAIRLEGVFLEACNQFNELITDEFAEIDRALYAEAKAVEDRPYRLAELNSDGTPLAQVYSVREDEIDYLYMTSLMHKAEVFKTIKSSLLIPIEKKYEDFEKAISNLNNSFEIPIRTKGDFSVKYDSNNYSWIVTVDLTNVLRTATKIQFVLSYEEMTGNKIQSAKYRGQSGYEDYMQFLDEVDYIDALMRSFNEYFDVTLTFNANVLLNEASKIGFSSINYSLRKVIISSNATNENKAFSKEIKPNITSCNSSNLFYFEMPKYLKIFDIKGFSF